MKPIDLSPKKKLLEQKLYPSKRWGQNFLNNEMIVKKILTNFDCETNDGILEIGPGLGIMTRYLFKKAKRVVSIEIDQKLVKVLEEQFATQDNFRIIKNDFLDVDLITLVKEEFKNCSQVHVVANLPYYVTTPILFKLFDNRQLFTSFLLMMQKEVAERITSLPNKKTYNNLSVMCQYYSDVKISLNIKKSNFFPQPQVDSCMVSFKIKNNHLVANEKEFNFFLRKIFAMKRKTLVNNLNFFTKNKLHSQELVQRMLLAPNVRSEQLTVQQFVILYHFIKENDKIRLDSEVV